MPSYIADRFKQNKTLYIIHCEAFQLSLLSNISMVSEDFKYDKT